MEILIEQNAVGNVRLMEVAAHAPVSALMPAIVDELQLPRTDLFGKPLVYVLRHAPTGPVLPDDKSLASAGIGSGAKLALDSYVLDGSVAALMQNSQGSRQLSFYASQTLADSDAFLAQGMQTSGLMPVVQRKSKGRWSRRAFLLLGGAVLGAGTASLGYAAYRSFITGAGKTQTAKTLNTPAPGKSTAAPFTPPTSATAGLVFMQHHQNVRAVTWSPDGKMLASGANDRQLLTWDLNGVVHTQAQEPATVHAVAWSPDGQWLAIATTNHITILNAVSGALQAQSMDAHNKTVTTLAWSLQQPLRLLSGSIDMRAIIWDMPAFAPQTVFTGHTAAILAASWASDNLTVATSSQGGVIRVWNAGSGQEAHGYYIDAQLPMRALSFSPTSSMLAVGGDDGLVRLWNNGLTCQQEQQSNFGKQCMDAPQRLHAHDGIVRALAWSPDGRLLATGGDDGTLAVWYPAQSQMPLVRVHQDAPLLALAWSPSGKQMATASGNTVTLWGLH